MAVPTCAFSHAVQLRSLTQDRKTLATPAKGTQPLYRQVSVSSGVSLLQRQRQARASTSTVAAATAVPTLMASATFSMPADVFVNAARVTAVYATMFAALLIWQGVSKLRLAAACQAKKEPFDRYNDKRMLPYDRTIGNFVEWAVPFLCLFWISMMVTNGATLKWGWVYVAARAAYPVAAVNKGIGTVGAKGPILLSTVPGYIALVNFIIPTFRALI